jgi:hypothetical protein
MTTAIDRPLADSLDAVADVTGQPTRALCARDPAAWDYERDTPPMQIARAESACKRCPLYRRCSKLLLSLPYREIPWGTVMAGTRLPWYDKADQRWRRRLIRTVERYAAPDT